MFYRVPRTNPLLPYATAFGYTGWEESELHDWERNAPGTVPYTNEEWNGPIPGPEVGALVGSADEWLNGLDYDRWIAGGYTNPNGCAPAPAFITTGIRQAETIVRQLPTTSTIREVEDITAQLVLSGGSMFVSQAETVGGYPVPYGDVLEAQSITGDVDMLLILRGVGGTPSYGDVSVLEFDPLQGWALTEPSPGVGVAELKTQMSVTTDVDGHKLVNDVDDPGPNMTYKTDSGSVKGWHPDALPVTYPAGALLYGDGDGVPSYTQSLIVNGEADFWREATSAAAFPIDRNSADNAASNFAPGDPVYARVATRRMGGANSGGFLETLYARATNVGNETVLSLDVGPSTVTRRVWNIKSNGQVEIATANTPGDIVSCDAYGNLQCWALSAELPVAAGVLGIAAGLARLATAQTWTALQSFADRVVVSGAVPTLHLLDTTAANTGGCVLADGGYIKLGGITDAGVVGNPELWVSVLGGGCFIGVDGLNFAQQVNTGFSASYKTVKVGHLGSHQAVAYGVDVSANTSGNFNGPDYFIANDRHWLCPNAANNDYRHVLHQGTDDSLNLGNRGAFNNWCLTLTTAGTVKAFHLSGWTDTPSVTTGTGAGAGATVSVAGNDTCGQITLNQAVADTPAALLRLFTLTFAHAYESAPRVVLVPANAAALALAANNRAPATHAPTTTAVEFWADNNALPPTTLATYIWNYIVIQ
jgi:hypothetical protein